MEAGSYEPFGGDQPARGTISTEQAYSGTRSFKNSNTAYLNAQVDEAFPDSDADYFVSSCYVYPDSVLANVTLFGYRDAPNVAGLGRGFTLYSNSTGFSVYAQGAIATFGDHSLGSWALDTWHHVYVQVHWNNGHSTIPNIAVWINGVHCGAFTGALSYDPPNLLYMPSARAWHCTSRTDTSSNTTYYDNLRLTSSATPYIDQASTAQITPSLVEAWFADGVPPLPEATVLRTRLGIGEYVDDAAAGTGGVASGAMYYNTTSGDYRLKS